MQEKVTFVQLQMQLSNSQNVTFIHLKSDFSTSEKGPKRGQNLASDRGQNSQKIDSIFAPKKAPKFTLKPPLFLVPKMGHLYL